MFSGRPEDGLAVALFGGDDAAGLKFFQNLPAFLGPRAESADGVDVGEGAVTGP